MAIGTHDLSTIEGPFRYDALPPSDIEFVPLTPNDKVRPAEVDALWMMSLALSLLRGG